ncbi:hypothetical protein ONZ51_g2650 [Trametes cubensis]|uniref:Heterokaryon incompatibility domain-containing protein n=1 Tax=Trametes cubensis TaxID=1111947 RepID=A0AAD7XEB5_9APHY|nr:hypothetical protein ONZ51_g2650 [Trametes cubensis]
MALPPRPPTICATAWEGVVAAQFGLFNDPINWGFIWDGDEPRMGGYEYTISLVVWMKCAKAGCSWCRFLAGQFMDDLKGDLDKWPSPEVQICVGRTALQGDPWSVMAIIVNGIQKEFRLFTTEGHPAARWIKKRILLPHVGWPYALTEAKTRVEECIRGHRSCQAITSFPIGSAPLPTRLIDCSNPDHLRIIETDSSMRGTYVALSYVWGERSPAYRTTEANLSSYKIRIDMAVLPRTILDAIRVTYALGITLLWVDGLCIVQDSENDMHHELARMRSVYRHAFLTIDAGSAASVSEGFLQDRELDPPPDAVFPLIYYQPVPPIGGVPVGMIYLTEARDEEPVGSAMVTPRDEYYTCTDIWPSNGKKTSHTVSRGWCLQERLLSTRSLVFTAQTLQLRCHTQTQNVGGARHDAEFDVPRLPDAIFHPDRHIAHGSDEWTRIHGRWWEIIKDYTSRTLSDSSDRLVAISGLAEMFAPILGPDYVAGLWKDNLFQDLLWDSDTLSSFRGIGYLGPSWSWASIDRPVIWNPGVGNPWDRYLLAEVVKCTVALRNKNLPFGMVTGGSLILRATLFRCKWSSYKTGNTETRELVVDFPPLSSVPSEELSIRASARLSYKEDIARQDIWIIPLLIYREFAVMRGLVVTRAELDVWQGAGSGGVGKGHFYRRVAAASCWASFPRSSSVWNNILDKEDRKGILRTKFLTMLSQPPRVEIELL